MKKNKLLLMLFVATLIGTTFSSCEKEECDVCAEMPTTIKSYEKTVLIRFKVPKDGISIDFNGTLLGYNEFDAAGNHIDVGWQSKTFKTGSGIEGDVSTMTSPGEPVTGAEIYIAQDPNTEPMANSVRTDANGHFTITHNSGFKPGQIYVVLVKPMYANNDKSGFAVGGYRLD